MDRMPEFVTFFPRKLSRRVESGLQSGCTSLQIYFVFVACALTTFFGGCGGRGLPERAVVSGIITYNGKPISQGTIRFVPGGASSAPVSGAQIRDGVYKADRKGGVPLGTHKIEIEAVYNTKPSQSSNPNSLHANEVWMKQYLPDKYNRRSQLEITIEPSSGEITKNFELTE